MGSRRKPTLGGPETMYPEYRLKLKGMPIPPKVLRQPAGARQVRHANRVEN